MPMEQRIKTYRNPNDKVFDKLLTCGGIKCPPIVTWDPNDCPMCGVVLDRISSRVKYSYGLFLGMDGSTPIVSAVDTDGLTHSMSELWAGGLGSTMAGNAKWVFASEPSPLVGLGLQAPQAVAINANGNDVVDILYLSESRLVGAQEIDAYAAPGIESTFPKKLSERVLAGDWGPTSTRPKASTGFGLAYSQATAMLYVIGGCFSPCTKSMNSPGIQTLNLRTGSWQPLNVGYQAATYTQLAASYEAQKGELWILDQSPPEIGTGKRTLRLIKVTSANGTLTQVLSWTLESGENYRFFLLADRDGSMLMVRAGEDSYKITRFGFKITTTPDMDGQLLLPIVDADGYSFIIEEEDGSVRGAQYQSLQERAVTAEELAQDLAQR